MIMVFLFFVILFCFIFFCFIWFYFVYIYMIFFYIIRYYFVFYVDVFYFMRYLLLGCGKSGFVFFIWIFCSGFMEKSLFFWSAFILGFVGISFLFCVVYSKYIFKFYILSILKGENNFVYRIRFLYCFILGRSIKVCIFWLGFMWVIWLKLIGLDIIFDFRFDF